MSFKEFLTRLEIFQLKMRRLKNWQPLQGNQEELAALEQERDTLRDELSTYNPENLPDLKGDARDKAAESPDLKEPLTDRDREILLYMLENGHTKAKPISKPELAKKLTRGGHKSMTDHLQAEGLVDSKRGVGTWLTAKGRSMAELIKQNEPY